MSDFWSSQVRLRPTTETIAARALQEPGRSLSGHALGESTPPHWRTYNRTLHHKSPQKVAYLLPLRHVT